MPKRKSLQIKAWLFKFFFCIWNNMWEKVCTWGKYSWLGQLWWWLLNLAEWHIPRRFAIRREGLLIFCLSPCLHDSGQWSKTPLRKGTQHSQLSHVEIFGELHDIWNSINGIHFFSYVMHERIGHYLSLVSIIPYRQMKAWLNYLQIFNSLNFSDHRRKLSSFPSQSRDISGFKLYVNPNLNSEHRSHQIEILQIFYT